MKIRILKIAAAALIFLFVLFYSKIINFFPNLNIDKTIILILFCILAFGLLIFDFVKNKIQVKKFTINIILAAVYFSADSILFNYHLLYNLIYLLLIVLLGLVFLFYGIFIRKNRLSSIIIFIFGVSDLTTGIYQILFIHK